MVSVLTKKAATIRRIVQREGVAGVTSIVREKMVPFVNPPVEYAKLLPSAVAALARHGRPDLLVTALGAGIGDDILCTAIFRELRRRGHDNFWFVSRWPALFEHNPDAPPVVRPLERYDQLLRGLGADVAYAFYTSYNPAFDRDEPLPMQHLISIMCQKAGITGTIDLRPYMTVADAEAARGKIAPRQIAIQSAGLDAAHSMHNKNWYLDGYQGVVNALKDRYDFVQLGSRSDPPLEGAVDLRGKTSLRETAAVLSQSLAFVGQVGMLMHMARAVDCRAVVVYGGRELPSQSGYPCNENLYSPVSCSPCWRLNSCPYDRMCLRMIGVDQVVDALEAQVGRYGTPLECATDTITEAHIMENTARYAEAVRSHQYAWSVLYP